MVLGTFFLAAVPQDVAAHKPSSAGSALRLCSLVDEWGKAEKCSVSEWYVERAAKLHLIFDVNWQIHIHSPSSGEHTIAFCDLR